MAGEDDGEITRLLRRRLPSSAGPLDDDDIMAEILLRLPPRPSSLLRSSLVCTRWRRLVSDPRFLRRFRAHHRAPPLLGFFSRSPLRGVIRFTPALDSPDHVPAARFCLRLDEPDDWEILSCRHGRVLVVNREQLQVLLWAPVTGDQRCVAFPPAFGGEEKKFVRNGVVSCAAGEEGHVHGSCHSNPFQVILLGCSRKGFFACVYSSETGAWGNLISLISYQLPDHPFCCSSTVVGNSIYSLLTEPTLAILEFDFNRQSLVAIEVPSDAIDLDLFAHGGCQFLIAPADGGGFSFVVLSGFNARLWKRRANSDGFAGWVLKDTIELSNLLSLRPGVDTQPPRIIGFAEDDNVIFLWTDIGAFMVNLESRQFKKLTVRMRRRLHHPFRSFFPAGI
ncbi:uncharacterized protein LOC133885776 [Phragmites australis]|uniref:uncharacterized protein LOC133885776 n=1 Tax=Phragmites australis TaxID=29695 RepID=UPI002D76F66D|nr:uncharacterized protein LOC133885776 [Phragmites australis]